MMLKRHSSPTRTIENAADETLKRARKVVDDAWHSDRSENLREALPHKREHHRRHTLLYVLLASVAGVAAYAGARRLGRTRTNDHQALPYTMPDVNAAASESAKGPGMQDDGAAAYESLAGKRLVDISGEEIGAIDSVFYREEGKEPEWVEVHAGMLTDKLLLAPLDGATIAEDVSVPYEKGLVDETPAAEGDTISEIEEERLYRHYNLRRTSHMEAGQPLPPLKRRRV